MAGYIILLTAHAAGGEWDVAQPALSIGGMQGGDRWWRGDGATPSEALLPLVRHQFPIFQSKSVENWRHMLEELSTHLSL